MDQSRGYSSDNINNRTVMPPKVDDAWDEDFEIDTVEYFIDGAPNKGTDNSPEISTYDDIGWNSKDRIHSEHKAEPILPSKRKKSKHKLTNFKSKKKNSLVFPFILWFLSLVVICFILPRSDYFNHFVAIDESSTDTGVSFYLKMGDEGYDVAHLQRALYTLGYIEFKNVNSRFDDVTLNALNHFLEDRGMRPSTECSYDMFVMVTSAAPDEPISDSDVFDDPTKPTENTAEQTSSFTTASNAYSNDISIVGSTTTTATALADNTVNVRILVGSTNLYKEADTRSATLFYLEKKDEYKLLEEYTDTNGKKWMKIRYKVCDGWIEAERAEIIG